MERFIKPPESIILARMLCGFLAAVDFAVTIIYILIYIFWPVIPTFDVYMILFQLFHVFSWAALLTMSSSIYSITYQIFVMVIYILALFADLIAFITRSVVLSGCLYGTCGVNINESRATFGIVLIYFIIDITALLFIGFAILNSQDFIFEMRRRLSFICRSNELMNAFYRVPRQAFFFRNLWGTLLQIDLWITIGIVILLLLGFGLTTDFLYVLVFLIPHYFMWCIGRGAAGTSECIPSDAMFDPDNIFAVLLGYITMTAIDIGGIAFAFWVISPCLSASSTCTLSETILNVLISTLYIVLGAFSVIQTISAFVIESNVRQSLKDLAPHQKEIIRRDNEINNGLDKKRRTIEKEEITGKTE